MAFALTWSLGVGHSDDEARAAAKPPAQIVPARPARYTVPRPFVRVRTSAQLRAALARGTPRTIVLQRGIYDNDSPFLNPKGHSIYAARLGRAVLTAGIAMDTPAGQPGGVIQGLVVDIRDAAKSANGAAISVSGAAKDSRVFDVVLRGNKAIRSGLRVREPEGFEAARLVVRDFTDYGVVVDANEPDRTKLDKPFRLDDLDVAGVSRAMPGSSQGTGEACVWIGNPGIVERVRVRRCAWAGLWTGTATVGARFDRLDIDETRTGVYIEHFTRQSTFQRIRTGRRVRTGVNAEWADPDWGSQPASIDNVIQDSRFESWLVGVFMDEGTTRTIVRRSTFVGQKWAAIGDYKGVDNAYYGNDYRGIATGASAVTRDHIRKAGAG